MHFPLALFRLIALCVLAALAACSSVASLNESAPTPRATSSYTPGAPGYVHSAPVLRLMPSGLGTIGAGTSYSKAVLQKALPDFSFDTVQTMSEGELKWLLTAFRNGLQQVQFEPDDSGRFIARVHLVGQEAAGPKDERLGMSFAETNGAALSCRAGKGDWSGMALCVSADGALTYVYAPPEYANANGDTNRRQPAANARLVRIMWRSPAS